MHACVRDVFAIYDQNILPRLKMTIIKMFILYFKQIRHTDDFPSTGTRLVPVMYCSLRERVFYNAPSTLHFHQREVVPMDRFEENMFQTIIAYQFNTCLIGLLNQ